MCMIFVFLPWTIRVFQISLHSHMSRNVGQSGKAFPARRVLSCLKTPRKGPGQILWVVPGAKEKTLAFRCKERD